MTPYNDFTFFLLVIILACPVIILGILEKNRAYYSLISSIIVILYIFLGNPYGLLFFCIFTIWQYSIIKTFYVFSKQNNSYVFATVLLLSLAPLILTKLTPLLKNTHHLGFLGISYLSFKCLQILIEIKDGLIENPKFLKFITFLIFFPVISAGPIDRSRRFIPDADRIISREKYIEMLFSGIDKIFQGLLYKFILAYVIYNYWLNPIIAIHKTLFSTILYMYGYSFYLFFDFAGYSLLAIGTSYIWGIHTPDNFRVPFFSSNIKDFWNRWHISLSTWFRDFVYMRIVFFFTKRNAFKSIKIASSVGYLISFGLMGLWHGLELHYFLYGLYHALLLILTDTKHFSFPQRENFFMVLVYRLVTFHFVCWGFLIFSGYLF